MELSVKEDLCDSMEQKIETAHNDKEIIVESGKTITIKTLILERH